MGIGWRVARLGVLVSIVLACSVALAYPSAVIFAPHAEVKPLGELGLFGYGSLSFTPVVGPSSTWFGVQAGVIPKLPYGKSGFEFGGMEVGVDVFWPDLAGTPDSYAKPQLNFKLQVLVERGWVPSTAVGVMSVSPYRAARSLNVIYGVFTKTLDIRKRSYGRFTLGLAGVGNDFTGDPYRDAVPAFVASWPFPRASRVLLLAGYETPVWKRVSFAVDHVGGTSELSSTNVAVTFAVAKVVSLVVGGWFGSDLDHFASGAFTYLYATWDLKQFAKPLKD